MAKSIRNQKGLTILELVMVIMVIGVLAATAIPEYQNYVSRTQITRVYSELSAYKQAIETSIGEGTISNSVLTPEASFGFVDSNLSTTSFGGFDNLASSYISGILDGASSNGIKGTEVRLNRSSQGLWSCTVTGAGNAWNNKLTPASCSN